MEETGVKLNVDQGDNAAWIAFLEQRRIVQAGLEETMEQAKVQAAASGVTCFVIQAPEAPYSKISDTPLADRMSYRVDPSGGVTEVHP